jgi:hypothetical protein
MQLEGYYVGFEVLTAVIMKSTILKETSLPSAFTLIYCSAYFSTMKMEAICSSETSIDTQWTTRRYIPEDGTLQNVIKLERIYLKVKITKIRGMNKYFPD